ncbi:ABC transporter permease [Demequina rhizosphaerae]|uniref:ABC transporter permease n=1 Tax=Demequina rhizosphaerae TaxID=1638985 RepID=UPI00078119F7|nr:ABC transporter permease [Demequina rhizosphaerae]
MSQASTERQGWRPVIGLAVGLSLLLSAMLVAFGLPAVSSGPHDVPIAVVAPDEAATQITGALDQAQPGAFDVTIAASEDEAIAMIRDREVYGAFVVGQDGLSVDIATAASPAVAQVLTAVGEGAAAQLGAPATVNDVVPTTEDDPRAIGLTAGALPIALGGFIAGVATTLLVAGTGRRLAAVGAFAVIAGLAMTAILQFWFGTFDGSFWATAAAAMLGIIATSAIVLGLESLLGRPGIGVAALLVVLLGNPLSGLASAPEMLPTPWGAIGQLLPPGATGTLLRNVAFFDGAAIATPILVLLGWLALGVALLAIAGLRARRAPAGERAAVVGVDGPA